MAVEYEVAGPGTGRICSEPTCDKPIGFYAYPKDKGPDVPVWCQRHAYLAERSDADEAPVRWVEE